MLQLLKPRKAAPRRAQREEIICAPLQDIGSARQWLATRDSVIVAYVVKSPDTATETHPYKVIRPAFGPGGVRWGAMVAADYQATTPHAAVRRALHLLDL